MTFKDLLDEVRVRGEKLKDEVLDELVNSKTLGKIVSNPNFVDAVSRVITTTEEVKRSLQKQVTSIFRAMNVPSKVDIAKVGARIAEVEKSIDSLGGKKIAVKKLAKKNTKISVKKAPAKKGKKAKK